MNYEYEFSADDALRFRDHVGIKARQRGNELTFWKCPYCKGGSSNDTETFAINLKTGQFKCLRASCQEKGNMLKLAKDYDFELSSDVSRYLEQGRFSRNHFRSFGNRSVETRDAAVVFMESRGISEEITRKYEITVRTDDESKIVFPFRDQEGVIRFVKYRNTKQEDIDKYGKEFAEKNGKAILFGIPQCNPENSTLILTEGQIDSMSVAEAGFENAVSVPTGAGGTTWIPHTWDWIQNFEKIIVFGDHENGEITLLDMVSERFHRTKSIYHVREKDYKDCKDANDILRKYGKEQIAECIENAVPVPVQGLVDIGDIEEDDEEYTRLPTGIYPLDQLLSGGIPTGMITLLNGRTGEGKSCFAHQIALNIAAEGHEVMIYSGELPKRDVKKQIMKQAAGDAYIRKTKNVYGCPVYRIGKDTRKKINDWIAGRIYIYNTEISSQYHETEDLLSITEKAITQYGVRFIVIDNLMTAIDLISTESNDQYSRQGEFVNKLAIMAKEFDVAILLVAHRRKSGYGGFDSTDNEEVSGSSHITNLVGLNIFYGRIPREVEYEGRSGKPRIKKEIDQNDPLRYIKVSKNRLDGQLNLTGIEVEYEISSNRIYCNSKDHNNRDKDYGWLRANVEESGFMPVDDLDEIPF